MIIIVDAYNFIKHVTGDSFVSDREMLGWINRFQEYTRARGNEIILVFDAGPGLYEVIEQHRDVVVMYSGQMQSADDVIKTWLSKHQGQDVLLVTSDREICTFADELQFVSVGSDDFYKIFTYSMDKEVEYEQQVAQTLHKTTDEQSSELDSLMEMGSRQLVDKQVEMDDEIPFRVRGGRKASKMDKRLLRKIEKI